MGRKSHYLQHIRTSGISTLKPLAMTPGPHCPSYLLKAPILEGGTFDLSSLRLLTPGVPSGCIGQTNADRAIGPRGRMSTLTLHEHPDPDLDPRQRMTTSGHWQPCGNGAFCVSG